MARGETQRAGSDEGPHALSPSVVVGREETPLQSRCTDETGYLQPTREELVAVRGFNATDHYNGIKIWYVHPTERSAMYKAAFCIICAISAVATATLGQGQQYKLGRPATPEEIRQLDISVAPDGSGLPRGRGTVNQGQHIYHAFCANCHGIGVKECCSIRRLPEAREH